MFLAHPRSAGPLNNTLLAAMLAAATAAAILLGGARSAAAIDSQGELLCQIGTSQAVGQFIRAKAQCIENCRKNAYVNGEIPDCSPPYDSGAIQGTKSRRFSKCRHRLRRGA